jgi:hypothetical protein
MSRLVVVCVAFLLGGLCGSGGRCTDPKPHPAPAAVAPACWGLERWQVEGDSVMILKFHKMPKEAK